MNSVNTGLAQLVWCTAGRKSHLSVVEFLKNRVAALAAVVWMLACSMASAVVTTDNISFMVIGKDSNAMIRLTEECYNCSESDVLELLQQRVANANFDFEFIVLDRARPSIRKFLFFYAPGGVPFEQPEGPEKDLLTGSIPENATAFRADIADFLVYEPSPTAEEVDAFQSFKRLVEEIYGIHGPTPPGTHNATFEVQIPPGALGQIDSAFDIESNGDELDVGLWAINNHTTTMFWQITLEKVTNWFGFRLLVQFKAIVFVTFDDGSTGLWGLNDRDELDLIDGSLRDSDGNPIPRVASDVEAGSEFRFFQFAPGERNLERFLERMRIFGIRVTGDTSGTCPTRCRLEAGGVLSCTLQC